MIIREIEEKDKKDSKRAYKRRETAVKRCKGTADGT